MTNQSESAFYSAPGPMTDLSGCPPEMLEGLPDTVPELLKVVRGCVIDPATLTQILELETPSGRDHEAQIRPVAKVIEQIQELNAAPLIEARPPLERFFGTCRNYATLSCALLRYKSIPARVRAGFGAYFVRDTWVDHWIIEYWRASDERWVRVDPEQDDDWLAKRFPVTTSELLASTMYLSGTEAWSKCRSGELDANRFQMGGTNWGIGEIRGSVLYDFAALNQDEMLPWDCWGQMEAAYKSETDAAYDELLDEVSDVVIRGDFDAMRALYDSSETLKVPAVLSGA